MRSSRRLRHGAIISVDPLRFFPPGYGDARAAFLRAAERRGAVVASHPIRARGPRGARRLLWLDLHTGLGAWGDYEFVSQHELDDPAFVRGRAWFGDKVRSTRSGDSVSALLVGDMLDGAPLELDATCEVSAFAPEFGTWDTLRVFLAMRADNWLHHHGDPESAQGLEIKRERVEVFRPDHGERRRRILAGGAEILQQAAAALACPLTLGSGAV